MNKPAAPSDTPKLSQSQQPPQKINTPIVPPASMPAMLELADKPLDTQSIAGATDPVLAAAAIAEPVAKPRPAGPAIASVETLVASKAPMGSLSPMPRSEVLPVASASLADNPIVVLPPLAQRGQDAPLPVEPVVSVPVESGPRVSYVKALPRYGGGAPPIRFTVASTGETYTLSPVWSTEEALGALSMVGPWEADVRFGQRIAQVLENFHKGEYEASVLGLRELVAERPEEPALQAALGEVYVRQERYGEALPFYQAAARQSPDHHRLRYATLLYLSGDWQAALPLLQDEHRRQPNHPLIAYQIGRIHQQRGEYASARLFLQKAARQSPDSPEIQYQLGITLEMLNERAAAKVAYARAKQLNPEAGYISLALTRLGKTYSR